MPRARNAPKLWPGDAVERDVDRVLGQALRGRSAARPRPRASRRPNGCALRMRYFEAHRLLALERRRRACDQLVVERPRQAVVLRFALAARHFRRHLRLVEDPREVEAPRLPVLDAVAHVEQVGAADHLRRTCATPSFAMSSRTSSATKKK